MTQNKTSFTLEFTLTKRVKDLIDVVANRCYCLDGVEDINVIKHIPISNEKALKLWDRALDKAGKTEQPVVFVFTQMIEKEHRIEQHPD